MPTTISRQQRRAFERSAAFRAVNEEFFSRFYTRKGDERTGFNISRQQRRLIARNRLKIERAEKP